MNNSNNGNNGNKLTPRDEAKCEALLSEAEMFRCVPPHLRYKLIQEMKPDIVLLDLMMPEMNGEEMLQKLRASDWGKDIKVIVLTNMGESEVPASIKELNVRAFILKANMTPRQVAELVKEQLNS